MHIPLRTEWSRDHLSDSGRAELLDALFGHVDFGICVLDSSGQLLLENRAASIELDSFQVIGRRGSSLCATCSLSDRRLNDAMSLACRQSMVATGPWSHSVILDGAGERSPMQVTFASGAAGRPLIFFPLSSALQPLGDARALFDHYRLSGAEHRLALCLCRNMTLAQAAAAMDIKEHTARGYLKQIFLKTGCNRQSELMYLVATAAAPLKRQR